MSDSQPQATIRVRKKDGTFVSMTPDEFAVYQASTHSSGTSSSVQTTQKKEVEETFPSSPAHVSPPLPPHFRPYIKPRSMLRPVPVWTKDKDVPQPQSVDTSVVSTPVTTPVSPIPSKQVVVDDKKNTTYVDMKKRLEDHSVAAPLAKNLPLSNNQKLAPQGIHALSRTTPVSHIFVDEAQAALSSQRSPQPSVSKKVQPSGSLPLSAMSQVGASDRWLPRHMEETIRLSRKTKMTDVQPPPKAALAPAVATAKKYTTGPIDEIAQLSCSLLRQFVADPAGYASFLLDKFTTLQKDSYLLYLEAIDAFHESPLWQVYQQVVSDSLSQKQSIESLVSSKNPAYDGMTYPDFLSLVSVTSYLQI